MLVMLTLIQNSCPMDVFWRDSAAGAANLSNFGLRLSWRAKKVHGARAVDLTIAYYRHDALDAIFKSQMHGVREKPDERAETADLALIRIKDSVERRGGADARDADGAMFRMAALSPLRSEERGEHLQFVLNAMTNPVYLCCAAASCAFIEAFSIHPSKHFHAVTVYGRTASLTS
jgi:hypothetical protein